MKKIKRIFIGILIILVISGIAMIFWRTTENYRAKNWSGTAHIYLEPNQELINVTWKEESIWYLVRDTISGDHIFIEKTPLGMIPGGRVVIKRAK